MVRSINIARTDNLVWDIVMATCPELLNFPEPNAVDPSIPFAFFDARGGLPVDGITGKRHPFTVPDDVEVAPSRESQQTLSTVNVISRRCALESGRPRDLKEPAANAVTNSVNSLGDEDKRAFLQNVVNKITVHFDADTSKHWVDVKFQPSIKLTVPKLAAEPEHSEGRQEDVCGPSEAVNAGEGIGDRQLTLKKPMACQQTQGTFEVYSVTVE